MISNRGAFGDHVVKIGLTRRLEPVDRINELGDASVPFRFDVHALYFSEDAVAMENELHQHFSARRMNWANMRKEFFFAHPRRCERSSLRSWETYSSLQSMSSRPSTFRVFATGQCIFSRHNLRAPQSSEL